MDRMANDCCLVSDCFAVMQELLKKIEQLEKKTSCGSFAPPQLEDSRKWMQAMLAQKQ